MRILQVSNFFKPSWETGGVTKIVYELSINLVKLGHDVTVYTTDSYESDFEFATNKLVSLDGIKVYYFHNIWKPLIKKLSLTTPYYLPLILRNEIKNFDIIHIHEHRTLSAIFIHHYAKKHGIPYVLQSHGSILPSFKKSKLKRLFDHFFGYNILNGACQLIALTEIEAKQYLQMGLDESKIRIIPNGLNIKEFNDLPIKGKFRKKYSLKSEEKVILYLGRIDKIKGIDILIDTFSDLIDELNNARLVIVGPNSDYLSTLKQQTIDLGIVDNVLFTGPLYGCSKLEAYVDANVLVYPSKYEIFGLVPFEAIMCGTPVIVTDSCCISNIVKGKLGYVIEFDKDALKSAICNIFDNNNIRINYEEDGVQVITKYFDWSNIIKVIEDLYINCLNSHKQCDPRQ